MDGSIPLAKSGSKVMAIDNSDEQIVRILRETDKDTVAEVAKRYGG